MFNYKVAETYTESGKIIIMSRMVEMPQNPGFQKRMG